MSIRAQALFLTLLILTASLIFRSGQNNSEKSFGNNIQDTSIALSAKPALIPPTKPNKFQELAQAQQALQDVLNIVTVPKRKEEAINPVLKVKIALAIDLESNTALFELNNQSRWPIASLTKLMTAVITLENVGKDKLIPVSERAFNTEGTAGNLQPGEVYTASDLIKAMLIVSSNDAASAIAEFYGEANLVAAMQQKAADLGMESNFAEPTGLSFVNQSSADDLVKLVKYVLASHPELLDITRQKTVELTEVNSGTKKSLTNINAFAGNPEFLGGKTGFIDAAGGNLISLFKYQNHKILIIIFGAEDRFGQTEILYNWIKQSYADF